MKAKYLAVFLFFYCLCQFTYAQTPAWLWEKTDRGSGNTDDFSVAQSVCPDAAGNVYLAGLYQDTVAFGSSVLMPNPQSTYASNSMFLAKYDASGNVLWAKAPQIVGTSGTVEAAYVTVDNGNAYVSGCFTDTVTFGSYTLNAPGGTYQMFLNKYDATGNVLWARQFNPQGTVIVSSSCTDLNHNIYVAGQFSGTFILGNDTLNSYGVDMFLAKFDTLGNVIWARTDNWVVRGGTGWATGVCVDSNENVYLSGASSFSIVFGNDTLYDSPTSYIPFLVKYDAQGQVLWAKSSNGGTGHCWGNSVCLSPAGNIYLAGDFTSTAIIGNDTLTAFNGSEAIFLSKFDAQGNAVWAQAFGQTSGSSYPSVCPAAGDHVNLAGQIIDSINMGSNTLTNGDMFVSQFDGSGNVVWAKVAGAIAVRSNTIQGLSSAPNGDILIAGSIGNDAVFGTDTLMLSGTGNDAYNAFVVKLGSIGAGVKPVNDLTQNIRIYPNPTNNQVFVESTADFTAKLFDLSGQPVVESKSTGTRLTFNVSNLAAGMYLLQVLQEGGVQTYPVTVMGR